MPKVGDFYESYRANEFVLEIGGTNHVYKVAATKIKFEPLTLERYVDGSDQDKLFQQWFRDSFDLNSAKNGGSGKRRNGAITKLHNGVPVLIFSFKNAWVKSSKFTDLEAGSTTLMKQTIVLEHEGLELEYKA